MATSQPSPQQSNAAQQPPKPATTQQDLTSDDGAGIRGGYGDADQTNGLEGGTNSTSTSDEGDDAGQGQ